MPKFTGKLMFDVIIEELTSQEAVDKLSAEVVHQVNLINGVDDCEKVDQDIDEEESDDEAEVKDS